MKKDRDCRIIRLGDRILRILDAEGEKALVIDCVKMGMPKWISLSEIEDGVEIPGKSSWGRWSGISRKGCLHLPDRPCMRDSLSFQASCPVWGIKAEEFTDCRCRRKV